MSFRSRFGRNDPDRATDGQDTDPKDDGDGDSGGEWIAYELHEWASESRRMLQQLVIGEQVAHSWQGTTLLVHETLESTVDELIDEVQSVGELRIEPDDPVVGFEMQDWSSDLQAALVERLGQASVAHDFDQDGDLVVRADDEEHVELLIDEVLARADDEGRDELEGLEVNDLLSAMFVACDRLRRDPCDADGVLGAVRNGKRISQTRTPYGFAATSWISLRDASEQLVAMLEEHDGPADDEDVRELAHRLRDTLHRLV